MDPFPEQICNIPTALDGLAYALDLPDAVWVQGEERDRLSLNCNVKKEKVLALRWEQADLLKRACALPGGTALTRCRFRHGDRTKLDVAATQTEQEFNAARAGLNDLISVEVKFEIEVDKNKLAQAVGGSTGGSSPSRSYVVLYLYSDPLLTLLKSSLLLLERTLWPEGRDEFDPTRKTTLLVAGKDVSLDGDYLAVLGGRYLPATLDDHLQNRPDGSLVRTILEKREESVHWDNIWLKGLTPLHLACTATHDTWHELSSILHVQTTILATMFLAGRVVGGDAPTAAIFPGTQQVRIEFPQDVSAYDRSTAGAATRRGRLSELIRHGVRRSAPAGTRSAEQLTGPLSDLVKSVYRDPSSVEGKLRAARETINLYLAPKEGSTRFRSLLYDSAQINEDFDDNWDSYIRGKVDDYFKGKKDLEDKVSETVASFSTQIGDLVKGLQEAMLAAVGTIVGTIIASLFQDTFNRAVFAVGMLAYAAYIFLFHVIFSKISQAERFFVIAGDYDSKRQHYIDALSQKAVEDIEGNRISGRKKSFWIWFGVIVATYLIVVGLAVSAANDVSRPDSRIVALVSQPTSQPTVVSTASITATQTSAATASPTITPTPLPTQSPASEYHPNENVR